jgi:hypothetical protein
MESDSLIRMTKSKLTQMCRKHRWNGYSKYHKADLLNFIMTRVTHEEQAAEKIQKWFRRRWLLKPRHAVNEQDIFTLENFPEDAPTFDMWEMGSNKIYRFHCRTLIDYFFSSGKFLNPFTRKPVSARNLRKLQRVYFEYFPEDTTLTFQLEGSQHLFTPWTNITRIRKQMKIERSRERSQDQLRGMLQSQCIDVINTIFNLILDLPSRQSEIVSQVLLYNVEYHLPAFFTSFFDLMDLDRDSAKEFLRYVLDTVSAEVLNVSADSLKVHLGWGVCKIILAKYNGLFGEDYSQSNIELIKKLVETSRQ